jgi:hypothetical protein
VGRYTGQRLTPKEARAAARWRRQALGSRLVVTKTASGIEVTGTSGLIDRLAKELGIIPQKDASAAGSGLL